MKRMLKSNVLVRKMVGIETAGSLNILFTFGNNNYILFQYIKVTKFFKGVIKKVTLNYFFRMS